MSAKVLIPYNEKVRQFQEAFMAFADRKNKKNAKKNLQADLKIKDEVFETLKWNLDVDTTDITVDFSFLMYTDVALIQTIL
jgi:hypothetical protein